jgi:hypothetical protein
VGTYGWSARSIMDQRSHPGSRFAEPADGPGMGLGGLSATGGGSVTRYAIGRASRFRFRSMISALVYQTPAAAPIMSVL